MKRYLFLSRKNFKALVEALLRDYSVIGTIDKEGFPAFGEIHTFNELRLSTTPTHLSAKEFLFPPREVLLKLDIEDGTHEPVLEARPQVLIGLHSCDIHAMGLMDRVFSYGTPDPNYLKRREQTVVIGTECLPDAFCFCSSLGKMTVEEGFDLFLHEVKGGFLARMGSRKGAALLRKYTSTREASPGETRELLRFREEKERLFTACINASPERLPEVYSKSDSSPVWDQIGSICYGCGSCNHVCPTCYCFDVKDEVSSDLKGGERVRTWDGCTLEDFAKVAGGHNFRSMRAKRLRHRFNRKFNYLSERFDALFCVGCGRCSRTCLVEINISKVTNRLIKEYDEGARKKSDDGKDQEKDP